jgi:hypothetical protein
MRVLAYIVTKYQYMLLSPEKTLNQLKASLLTNLSLTRTDEINDSQLFYSLKNQIQVHETLGLYGNFWIFWIFG